MRILYFIAGWIFFILGAIGVVLPILPTTPFMLLALWAFSRSSERFYYWLYHHQLFGPPLQMWQQHRVIPVIAKFMSIGFMTISLIYMSIYSPLGIIMKLLIAAIMLFGAGFILTKPSYPPEKKNTVEA
jgi:uncharacterized protein